MLPEDNLCYGTCKIMSYNVNTNSRFSLGRPKMAQFAKMPFIVFRLASLIFMGQTNFLDMTNH